MTEEQIIAYVDGELGPIEALRFERMIEADPELAAEVARHRRVRETVARHFAAVADEPLPAELTRLLDSGDNVVAFPQRRRTAPWFGQGGRYAALAATLVGGLVIGQMLPMGQGPIGGRDGMVVAQGDLAEALGTTLAADPQHGANRIGVSFRTADNRYCRTFTTRGAAGIGCLGEPGWVVERFVAGRPAGETGAYAQAASPSAEIMAAAQEMMAGAPLDAAQERQVRAQGWLAPGR
jgi:hypothetical protein